MTDLLAKTRRLLAASKLPLSEIAAGAGDPVTTEWLKKFAGDYRSDPSVTRVQRVHNFLVKQKKGRAA
jgi:hypothetical protein